MATIKFANNPTTTLAGTHTDVTTTLNVAAGTGALFASPTGGDYFLATILRASDGLIEIVKCTARSTDALTVTRAQEGTTGLAYVAGDRIEMRITKGMLDSFVQRDATETITAKTLTSVKETRTAPTISGGTLTLDLSGSSVFDVSLNAAITTLTISNPAASGTSHGFILTFTADGTARAVTWPATILWPSATAPTLTSTNGKKDKFVFQTTDGGTTYHAFVVGQNL